MLRGNFGLELGRGDLDSAAARLQAVRRLLPTPIPEAQHPGPLFAGLVELALWRDDPEQAKQLVAQAVPLVATNPRYAAPFYALGLRIEADRAELARARHPGQPVPDDSAAAGLLKRVQDAAESPAAAGIPELAAWHATGLAERTRQHGPPTRRRGRRRLPRGSGRAGPTPSPTPASGRPRRCWPVTATATRRRRRCAAPPRPPGRRGPRPTRRPAAASKHLTWFVDCVGASRS